MSALAAAAAQQQTAWPDVVVFAILMTALVLIIWFCTR